MSEPKLIQPLLDNFAIGDPISDHNGVRCCPAMDNRNNDRFIVKIVANPASQKQLDALLLSGAFESPEKANTYFKEMADAVVEEIKVLQALSQNDGFLPVTSWQTVPMDDGETGYDVYILTPYRRTLERQFRKAPLTHLQAVNMGLDLCSALSACRRAGYLYVDLKPDNVHLTEQGEYRIGDLGFIKLDSLMFASLPDKYRSVYTPPEIADAFSSLNTTLDTYAVGLMLYQVYNNGVLPDVTANPIPAPEYADYELSEIIMKACDPDPGKRWEDPMQLGQALVSYMQRNEVNDTPIIQAQPAAIVTTNVLVAEDAELPVSEEVIAEEALEITTDETCTDTASSEEIPVALDEAPPAEAAEEETPAVVEEDSPAVPVEDVPSDLISSLPMDASNEPIDEQAQTDTNLEDFPDLSVETADAQSENPIPDLLPEDDTFPKAVDNAPDITIPDITINEILDPEVSQTSQELSQEAAETDALSFDDLDKLVHTDTEVNDQEQDIPYIDDLSSILSQIDELTSHPVPDPVVAPEAIEVPMPDPIIPDSGADAESSEEPVPEVPEAADTSETIIIDAINKSQPSCDITDDDDDEDDDEDEDEDEDEDDDRPRRKKHHWIRNTLLLLFLLGLIAGGLFFYRNYYIQTVRGVTVYGTADGVFVEVDTDIDPSLLTVTCKSYGSKSDASLTENWTTQFTGLKSDSEYTISVNIKGFHKLKGNTTATHYTPSEMPVLEITCLNGKTEGSVEVSFTVGKPDTNVVWKIKYGTQGQPIQEDTIENHKMVLEGLIVGKTYSVELYPEGNYYVSGNNTTTFTVEPLVYAKDLQIVKCAENTLQAKWDSATGLLPESWTVRCFNANGFDETKVVTESSVTFTGLDHNQAFNIEVTAKGQTLMQRTSVEENSVSIDTLTAEGNDDKTFTVTWTTTSETPAGGWILNYNISGSSEPFSITTEETTVHIKDAVPGRKYSFFITAADGAQVFAPSLEYQVPEADRFSSSYGGFYIDSDDIHLSMCVRPASPVWTRDDISNKDYTTSFSLGQTLAFTTRVTEVYSPTNSDMIHVVYVITDADNNVIGTNTEDRPWNSLWVGDTYRGILNGIAVPERTGEFVVTVYYNGDVVGASTFSVTS